MMCIIKPKRRLKIIVHSNYYLGIQIFYEHNNIIFYLISAMSSPHNLCYKWFMIKTVKYELFKPSIKFNYI